MNRLFIAGVLLLSLSGVSHSANLNTHLFFTCSDAPYKKNYGKANKPIDVIDMKLIAGRGNLTGVFNGERIKAAGYVKQLNDTADTWTFHSKRGDYSYLVVERDSVEITLFDKEGKQTDVYGCTRINTEQIQ